MKIKIHYTLYIFFIISFFFDLLIPMLLMFVILLFHELGHIVFLKKYNREITTITIFPFGGIIKHSSNGNDSLKSDFLIHIGGVLSNVILGFIFYLFNLNIMFNLNIGILIFNLLPIYPLDGGKILKDILCIYIQFKKVLYLIIIISILNSIILILINYYFIKSFYLYFFFIYLIQLNIKSILEIKKEFNLFLTNKLIYYNAKLRTKNIYKFTNPINELYQGKNVCFIIDSIKVEERKILTKYFKVK